jgi:hypothetical protein
MSIKKIKSKINLLNANIAQFHDSGMFYPEEAAILGAPLLARVQDLQEQIVELQAREYEVVGAEALTPQKSAPKCHL